LLEEIKALFEEIKKLVSELRKEEERSHREREQLLRVLVVEIKRIAETLDK